jgi:hypothetical protein
MHVRHGLQGIPTFRKVSHLCLPVEFEASPDSIVALHATAPVFVRSFMHVWPCSAPLQPSLPLPFPTAPLLVIFCANLVSSFPAPSPIIAPHTHSLSLISLCQSGTFAALTPSLSIFHSSPCRRRGTVGTASFCTSSNLYIYVAAGAWTSTISMVHECHGEHPPNLST